MTSRFVFGGARAVGVAALMFFSVAALPAAAQDVQNLLNRLDRMERDMQDLQRQLYRGGSAGITATPVTPAPITSGTSTTSAAAGGQGNGFDTSYAARVEVRLQQLETLIRSLTGKIEEVEFNVEQNSGRLDRLVRDIDFRLQALERGGVPVQTGSALGTPNNAAAAQTPAETPVAGQGQGVLGYLKQSEAQALDNAPASAAGAPAATVANASSPGTSPAPASSSGTNLQQILPDGTPEEQYKHAFTYLQKQDFASAEQALSTFLERHPKSPLAGNAMYWLGETYYVRKDFANAAKTFATGYTEYSGSSKTADNLLKLGFSLARMGRKEDACVTFDQLKADFPNASANIKRRAATERQRIGC
ncbi:tol-pal system protein YbgF [Nisaea sp.]|uniref:tol-pal system protein YbgF n=1 Tax=Nisaea sp. TaxID=2024842 RepID=UPI0032644B7A